MFSCLFSFLMKSREEHVNIFNKIMFIPISRHPPSHVKFSASLVTRETLFQEKRVFSDRYGHRSPYLAKYRRNC